MLEPEARNYYAFHRDVEPTTVRASCYKDESRMVGCSPDGLVGEDGPAGTQVPHGPQACVLVDPLLTY